MLTGHWFNDGFAGAMGEMLAALEDGREPRNSARANLATIRLCQATLRAARSGRPVDVGPELAPP
jgi:predicted dehydrogenase